MNKVLFVEDGSVDVDELQEILPEVPIIIYRQGSLKPEFQDVDTPVKVVKKEPCEPEGMCADKADPTFTPEEIRAAISEALSLKGESFYNAANKKYEKMYTLNPQNIEFFAACVLRELTEAKTCEAIHIRGADPSGDN